VSRVSSKLSPSRVSSRMSVHGNVTIISLSFVLSRSKNIRLGFHFSVQRW